MEVLITLALVTGTYAIAQKLGASGPLAVVAAGLLIGERAPRYAMSDTTQRYVSALWTLIDEVLNSVLFLLIGLEVLVLRFQSPAWPWPWPPAPRPSCCSPASSRSRHRSCCSAGAATSRSATCRS